MRTARRLTLQVGQELQRQQEERRLGAVYETEAVRQADGRVVPRTVRPTYIPFRGNVETFGQLVYLEAARRGLEDAGEVIILGDGAEMRYDELNIVPAAIRLVTAPWRAPAKGSSGDA